MPMVCAVSLAVAGLPVRAVIESMNGARFVHDTLGEFGWEVLVADAQKVKGLAPLACKTDKIDVEVPVREGVVLRLAWAASARTGGIDVLRAIDERLGDQR